MQFLCVLPGSPWLTSLGTRMAKSTARYDASMISHPSRYSWGTSIHSLCDGYVDNSQSFLDQFRAMRSLLLPLCPSWPLDNLGQKGTDKLIRLPSPAELRLGIPDSAARRLVQKRPSSQRRPASLRQLLVHKLLQEGRLSTSQHMPA